MGTPRGHYVGHLAPQVVPLGPPRSQMWLQGVPGWPHGSKTHSLEGQNSEIGDSCTFLIHFKGLWGVRGEGVQTRGSVGLQPFGLAREEELIS